MGLVAKMTINPRRAFLAAELYNNVYDVLVEHGWKEETKESPWYAEGEPQGSWRHTDHPGSWSMDAAYILVAQRHLGKRG